MIMKKILFIFALIATALTSCTKEYVTVEPEFEAKSLLDSVYYANGYSWRTLAITSGMYQHNVNFEVTTENGLNFATAGDWVGSRWQGQDSVAEIWSDVYLDNSYAVRMLEVFYHMVPEGAKSEQPILATINVINPDDSLGLAIEYKVKLMAFSKENFTE